MGSEGHGAAAGEAAAGQDEGLSVSQDELGASELQAEPGAGEVVECVLRLVIPTARVGAVIGKGGSVIEELRNTTGAKIRVTDNIPGCPERVVCISSEDPDPTSPICPAKEAMMRVFSNWLEADERTREPGALLEVKTLVHNSQAGTLIGRGGEEITRLREETDTQIRVFHGNDLPACALPVDRMVAIFGPRDAAARAFEAVVGKLRASPVRDDNAVRAMAIMHINSLIASQTGALAPNAAYGVPPPHVGLPGSPASGLAPHMSSVPPHNASFGSLAAARGPVLAGGGKAAPAVQIAPDGLDFEVPMAAAGALIGAGGNNAKRIRATGCFVRIHAQESPAAQFRAVELRGDSDALLKAQVLILHYFELWRRDNPALAGTVTFPVLPIQVGAAIARTVGAAGAGAAGGVDMASYDALAASGAVPGPAGMYGAQGGLYGGPFPGYVGGIGDPYVAAAAASGTPQHPQQPQQPPQPPQEGGSFDQAGPSFRPDPES